MEKAVTRLVREAAVGLDPYRVNLRRDECGGSLKHGVRFIEEGDSTRIPLNRRSEVQGVIHGGFSSYGQLDRRSFRLVQIFTLVL